MEEEEEVTPFWLQTTDRSRHSSSRISSIFFNSGVFLVVLLAIAFVFVFIVIPSFLNLASQIFRPHLIKKSWDSLNLVLVLFAIICGFLSRNTNQNNSISSSNYNIVQQEDDRQKSYPSTPRRRYEYNQDRTAYNGSNSLSRLRSFRSYPDLRQESLWVGSEERWRFYDDTHLRNYHPLPNPDSDQLHQHLDQDRPRQRDHDQEEQNIKEQKQEAAAVAASTETKDVAVDTFVTKQQEVKDSYTPPPVSPPSPPRPQSEKVVKRKAKRNQHDLGDEKRSERMEVQVTNFHSLPPPSPPGSPRKRTFGENKKKRGKDILNSIRKKKKQRQKSVENLDTFFDPPPSTSRSILPPPSPPPPPPAPPPPHFFQNLFSSKKGKNKKSTHKTPPPPNKAAPTQTSSRRQPVPFQTNSFTSVEENVDSGGASPLIPIPPPPPPPPPFKMPPWRFVLDGDFVRVGSFNSSRSGSSDLDGPDDLSSDKESPVARAETPTALFCPSPDVNTKADNFIATFRAGLRLEKINSVKGRSNLGPTPNDTKGVGPN